MRTVAVMFERTVDWHLQNEARDSKYLVRILHDLSRLRNAFPSP